MTLLFQFLERRHVWYNMHALVHDLATSVLGDDLIVIDASKKSHIASEQKYCRYALLTNYDGETELPNILPKKIHVLHFSSSKKLDLHDGSFSFAKCLRILDFSGCFSIILSSSIGQLSQLRCLIAPNVQNESLPESIAELSKLQYLNLQGSSLMSALPESIGNLSGLIFLCLSGCIGILEVPESFGGLKSLMHLDMSKCFGITGLPESIGGLKSLRHLDMSNCSRISVLPESIGGLKSLVHLDMSICFGITVLPESIGELKSLEHLDMSISGITVLPESFGGLENLMHLNMSKCSRITGLPYSLGNLTNLHYLDLSECSCVKKIPESLGGLSQLEYLNLSGCDSITRLPEAIGSLINLQYLYLTYSVQIEELPESFHNLQNLVHLDLAHCYCAEGLQEALCGLTTLEHLDMSKFQINDLCIPGDLFDAMGNLTNLKYLNLRDMNCYPDFIGTLTNLEHLVLAGNKLIFSLPESISNLKKLHTLDLSYCEKLKALPDCISEITTLKSLLIEGCSNELKDRVSSKLHYPLKVPLRFLLTESCSDELKDQTSSELHHLLNVPLFKVQADDIHACSNLHLLNDANVPELRICSLENVRFLDEAHKVRLLYKSSLSKLTLAWTLHVDRFVDDKDLLGQLVPPRGLKCLNLKGYSSPSFPSWIMYISYLRPNIVRITLDGLVTCSDLPPLGQLRNLEELHMANCPRVKKIDKDFCGGKGAFPRLSEFILVSMEGLEEWSTTYSVEDGYAEEFMFPMLHILIVEDCPGLMLKPCPPTFRKCTIQESDQVISSLEEVGNNIGHLASSIPSTMLTIRGSDNKSLRLFHHFSTLQELQICNCPNLTSLPESIRHLISLQSMELHCCESISALPEWIGDLFCLRSLNITGCGAIKSLPLSIQQLKKLQTLQIKDNLELKRWCESEENKKQLTHI
jgi:Leucine-rich repeat (LRR) protein